MLVLVADAGSACHLQPTTLYRLHGLKLVTTSLIYERMARSREPPRSVHAAVEEADGMAPSPQMVAGAYTRLLAGGGAADPVPAMQVPLAPRSWRLQEPHQLAAAAELSAASPSIMPS